MTAEAASSGKTPMSRDTRGATTAATIRLRRYLRVLNPSWGASLYIPQVEACAPASVPIRIVMRSVISSLGCGAVGGLDQCQISASRRERHSRRGVHGQRDDEIPPHRAEAADVAEARQQQAAAGPVEGDEQTVGLKH